MVVPVAGKGDKVRTCGISDDLGKIVIIPGITLITIRSHYIYHCIIGTISSADESAAAFRVDIDIGITEMPSESAISCLKKKPDGFTGVTI